MLSLKIPDLNLPKKHKWTGMLLFQIHVPEQKY